MCNVTVQKSPMNYCGTCQDNKLLYKSKKQTVYMWKKRGDFLVAFFSVFPPSLFLFFSSSFFLYAWCCVFVIYTFPRIIFFFLVLFFIFFLLLLRYYFFLFAFILFYFILFSSIHMYGWRNDASYLLLVVFG